MEELRMNSLIILATISIIAFAGLITSVFLNIRDSKKDMYGRVYLDTPCILFFSMQLGLFLPLTADVLLTGSIGVGFALAFIMPWMAIPSFYYVIKRIISWHDSNIWIVGNFD